MTFAPVEIFLRCKEITARFPPEMFQLWRDINAPDEFPKSLGGLEGGRSFGLICFRLTLSSQVVTSFNSEMALRVMVPNQKIHLIIMRDGNAKN